MAMLEIKKLELNYGVIKALKGIDMEVNQGEIVTLIGANGAGKSSTLKAISGIEKISGGEILFNGEELSKMNAQDIVKVGVSQVPEGRRIFAGMSVLENLEMGAYLRKDAEEIKESLELVYKHFPILKDRSKQNAATLSGGEQQMLAMGRALMSKPKLLLLDEPSMGLAPILVKSIFSIISDIKEQGTTVLLVEQNARMALSIADRAYVMETGKIVLSGNGKELMDSEEIQKAYLGG
ncbi:branched-chain amino acid transport system ATP-binding protein [Breznakia sp. PF5-3]|nr:branched-chain amino acid transport system ATP-binding protein [Breznakia sp. PM6-1]MDF9835478.1 branched-chain amino acid transport system ATP-binding protein [Breznakia sp. PF5-3]MDF9837888.1 branched-chain amino acid transport system ATP-binding protein [Breznakia sp. PFB2-8]MDF9859819.1 branched-chain amino acid transport system ATP-binding protein [Breznakia sp. PH5-24]